MPFWQGSPIYILLGRDAVSPSTSRHASRLDVRTQKKKALISMSDASSAYSPGWHPAQSGRYTFDWREFPAFVDEFRQPLHIIHDPRNGARGLAQEGAQVGSGGWPLLGMLPPMYPEWLGDPLFRAAHNVRSTYVGGEMARGIASVPMVAALAKLGMLGFFGAAGLPLQQVEASLIELKRLTEGQGTSFGVNLIHSPQDIAMETKFVDLYLKHDITTVCASAFTKVERSVVRYACKGLQQDQEGRIHRRHHVLAKVSRPEVGRQFMEPASRVILDALLHEGSITVDEHRLAQQVPVAEDLTIEADSGGHTDNRPMGPQFSRFIVLRDEICARYGYPTPVRLGAAGGLGTPNAIAAAYAMGAAYVVIGSVHQSALESGLSAAGRQIVATVDIADCINTIAADMFEMGAKVQVVRKGVMMGIRGNQLYDLYKRYDSLEDVPAATRAQLERDVFRASLDSIWEETKTYLATADPRKLTQAEKSPKTKMALIFRWYMGKSSRWPLTGDEDRKTDYQIWCGPAQGAFNAWVKDTFLEEPANRAVAQIALNLMEGATSVTRASQLRAFGVYVPDQCFNWRPRPFALN